jgi:hypothetical protein
MGYVDVAIALFCFITFLLLSLVTGQQKEPALRLKAQKITEYIIALPLLLIALYLAGIKINWDILLIGIGWRLWLLITALPSLLAALNKDTAG